MFQEASMIIREWTSNTPNILNYVEKQGIAGKRDTHVLGLQWTNKEDQFITGTIQATLSQNHSIKRMQQHS